MFSDFILFADFMSTLKEAVPVILGLIMIEGLLSVDNALAIAAMASHLDEKKRKVAMNIGYIGAYGFRIIALIFAGWLAGVNWIMLLGALYLVWLMCAHFAELKEVGADEGEAANVHHRSFAGTVTMIALMDLSLSVDNVVAAVGLSHDNMTYVYIGVTIGIITLRIVAGVAVKLIEKYPVLEHAAFLLIGFVGCLFLYELLAHVHFGKEYKFVGIVTILALSIFYSKNEAFARAMKPLLRFCLLPMELFAAVAGGVIVALTWPFVRLWRLIKPGTSAS